MAGDLAMRFGLHATLNDLFLFLIEVLGQSMIKCVLTLGEFRHDLSQFHGAHVVEIVARVPGESPKIFVRITSMVELVGE